MRNLLNPESSEVHELPFRPLVLTLPDIGTVEFAEPTAQLTVDHGEVSLTVGRFQRADSRLQILDNPKHYVVSQENFEVGTDVASTFTADVSAVNIAGNSDDYRDGLAVFSIADLAAGCVWDIGLTSTRAWAIHERLQIPGVVPRDQSFYRMVEDLYHAPEIDGSAFHRCAIELDPPNSRSRWFIDGELIHEARLADTPESVLIGFGFVTLRSVAHGKSTSLRGQGMSAKFRNICVS